MLPSGPRSEAVEAEQARRDAEARRYDHLLGLRLLSTLEIPAALRPLALSAADRVVDAGCGTGRFTLPLLRTGASVVAVDHSLESLRVLQGKLDEASRERVLLVQGDVTRLPVRSEWASAAVSCQVIEHLPSEPLRRAATAELARALEDGGGWAVSGYWYVPALGWLPEALYAREGRHSGAIFYRRFDRAELRGLLRLPLRVERLTARLVYILLAHGWKQGDPPKDGCTPRRKDAL